MLVSLVSYVILFLKEIQFDTEILDALDSAGSSSSIVLTQWTVFFRRILMSKENMDECIRDSQGLSALTGASPKPASSLFPKSKHQDPFEGTSSRADFGLVSADSLLNPSRTSYSENISFDSSSQLDDRQSQTHPLRHFIDDWPKTQSDCPPITWPEVEDMQSDRTQLSISIPTDFSSSSTSPNQEKLALSPLRLSREFSAINEGNQRHTSWIPISWEPTVGGPLGEVLNNTNSTPKGLSKNCSSSSLNLLTDGWDSSPRLEASPTGVLQKTTFGSLSSSTGSSPRADNLKTHDSASNLCDDLLGSTLVNPSMVPSL